MNIENVVMITNEIFKKKNEILVLNNPLEIDMPLNKLTETFKMRC